MKKARRIPRKIGQDDEGEQQQAESSNEPSSVVKRPQPASQAFKPKKPSNLRRSFAPSIAQDVQEEEESTANDAFAAVERKKAAKSARTSLLGSSNLPYRSPDTTDRPSYNADYLAELKQSQQSAPQNLQSTSDDSDLDQDTDTTTNKPFNIASKFGTSDALLQPTPSYQPLSTIPTDAEIREKKDCRRRLAREEKDFISLNDTRSPKASDSDSDSNSDRDSRARRRRNNDLIIPADDVQDHSADPGTRLGATALDDDDLAEGYDDFVEDEGRVALGRKARRAQEARRRADIAAQIAGAEGHGGGGDTSDRQAAPDSDSDPDERARLQAYEAAQTRHGTYSSRHTSSSHRLYDADREREERWRRITTRQYKVRPLPTMKQVTARFRGIVEEKGRERVEVERRLEGVRREVVEVAEEEERVRGLVREAGERLERLTGGNKDEEAAREREERRVARESEAEEEGPSKGGLGSSVADSGDGSSRGDLGSSARAGLGMASGLSSGAGVGGGRGLDSFAGLSGLSSSPQAGEQ